MHRFLNLFWIASWDQVCDFTEVNSWETFANNICLKSILLRLNMKTHWEENARSKGGTRRLTPKLYLAGEVFNKILWMFVTFFILSIRHAKDGFISTLRWELYKQRRGMDAYTIVEPCGGGGILNISVRTFVTFFPTATLVLDIYCQWNKKLMNEGGPWTPTTRNYLHYSLSGYVKTWLVLPYKMIRIYHRNFSLTVLTFWDISVHSAMCRHNPILTV